MRLWSCKKRIATCILWVASAIFLLLRSFLMTEFTWLVSNTIATCAWKTLFLSTIGSSWNISGHSETIISWNQQTLLDSLRHWLILECCNKRSTKSISMREKEAGNLHTHDWLRLHHCMIWWNHSYWLRFTNTRIRSSCCYIIFDHLYPFIDHW